MITEKIVEAGTVTAHRVAGQGFCRLSEGKGRAAVRSAHAIHSEPETRP
ncbi:hypothetical protein [Bosea sp. (in: a-proteobacteria)]|nr:hypothetical protein [Bosea sp. (in: a-proteobacteria)]MBN9436085.1 hypothetical protein [Bosea sp. (in: a-proteobacteria)]